MKRMKLLPLCAVLIAIAATPQLPVQVQTIVPDPVPGAKPVTVEHIKIHGTALEGNLEGDGIVRGKEARDNLSIAIPSGLEQHGGDSSRS